MEVDTHLNSGFGGQTNDHENQNGDEIENETERVIQTEGGRR